jgi:hypothetical protein
VTSLLWDVILSEAKDLPLVSTSAATNGLLLGSIAPAAYDKRAASINQFRPPSRDSVTRRRAFDLTARFFWAVIPSVARDLLFSSIVTPSLTNQFAAASTALFSESLTLYVIASLLRFPAPKTKGAAQSRACSIFSFPISNFRLQFTIFRNESNASLANAYRGSIASDC